jgi:methylenetetrahydrofolate dehydrogenase (NADP+)/methenyltetrahydrofolate cyclohydrolase
MILYAKPVIETKKWELKEFFSSYQDSYVAILFFGNDLWSEIYVRNKTRFGVEIGCKLVTFGQDKEYSYEDIIWLLKRLNIDDKCIGILIQLPLPEYLKEYQQEFCDLIDYGKDIDCMSSTMIGKICCGYEDAVLPAAVGATVSILKIL